MTSALARDAVRVVDGLSGLAPHYDLIICDVWGVLHNGLTAYPGAADALTRYRTQGGCVVLVSNAPRPGDSVVDQLDKLAVPRTAYDGIVTSGDLTRSAVAARIAEPVHHLGPPRDLPIFDGLPVRFAGLDDRRDRPGPDPCARGIHAHELGIPEGPFEAERALAWARSQSVRPHGISDVLVW